MRDRKHGFGGVWLALALLSAAASGCGDGGAGGGGPGDTGPAAGGAIVVNEVFAKPEGTSADTDWVELFHRGAEARDIGGWILRDGDDLHAFVIPDGTVMQAGGFLVFRRDETGAGAGFDFGLGPADMVRLYDADGALVDQTAWQDGQAPENRSWGRHPDGAGAFATLSTPTPGAPNAAPER